MAMVLRIKSNSDSFTIRTLTTTSSYRDLCDEISKVTSYKPSGIRIRTGYPPKPLGSVNANTPLSTIPIKSGDTLIVEEVKGQDVPQVGEGGRLERMVVPADNSCLFTSVDYCRNSGVLDVTCAASMREAIAAVVSADPDYYSEAVLGRGNHDYCTWIQRADSWGGGIEVAVMSRLYSLEIAVINVLSGHVDRFGEDQHYPLRILLLYDGIHYDPLHCRHGDALQTVFSAEDDAVLAQGLSLAREARERRQYTDTARFTLRCLICQTNLRGQADAQNHARSTGHVNFGEY